MRQKVSPSKLGSAHLVRNRRDKSFVVRDQDDSAVPCFQRVHQCVQTLEDAMVDERCMTGMGIRRTNLDVQVVSRLRDKIVSGGPKSE